MLWQRKASDGGDQPEISDGQCRCLDTLSPMWFRLESEGCATMLLVRQNV